MTRALLLIAGASFVLACAALGGAAALGGQALAKHGWNMADGHIRLGHWARGVDSDIDTGGPDETREIAWTGGDALELDAPADVRFTQSPGPAKLVITGPKGTVDQLTLSGPRLGFNEDLENARRVTVVMTAPNVRRFTIDGNNSLAITGFDQDELDIDLSGNGMVKAQGRSRSSRVDISGNGQVDLGQLAVSSADVEISGSGRADIAPKDSADLHISGSGEINLLTHPANLRSEVSGSGRINQPAAPPTT